MHSSENFHNEHPKGEGRLEVICGPMFSGKTEALLKRVEEARSSGKETVVIKPATDIRYSDNKVVSHDKTAVEAVVVESSMEILSRVNEAEVVAIDEVQFFDSDIVGVCRQLVERGIYVVASGLDLDSNAKPFGSMPELLVYADSVVKLQAVCNQTGAPARYTYRHSGGNETVELGEKDIYMPLSRNAFLEAMKNKGE